MKHLLKLKNIQDNKCKSGFTIVEVTLVMAFIGMLLIAVAMILSNIISVYQKGLVIKSVNSVGRGLISELTTTINSAPSIDSANLCNLSSSSSDCLKNGAFEYIYQSRSGSNGAGNDVQYGGVLCTGNYTYIWNTYEAIKRNKTITLTYQTSVGTPIQSPNNFKMIKFVDRNYRTCSQIISNSSTKADFRNNGRINITKTANGLDYTIEKPEDGFIESTDVDLYLYELTIFPVSQDSVTLRAFFSGTFILATDRGDVNIFRSGDYCNPNIAGDTNTLDIGSEFNYCAVNKFNFAARSTGKTTNK